MSSWVIIWNICCFNDSSATILLSNRSKWPHELRNHSQSEHVSLLSYINPTQHSMNSLWIIVLGINHALEMVHGMSWRKSGELNDNTRWRKQPDPNDGEGDVSLLISLKSLSHNTPTPRTHTQRLYIRLPSVEKGECEEITLLAWCWCFSAMSEGWVLGVGLSSGNDCKAAPLLLLHERRRLKWE